jgi:hypothetical protein
MLRYIQPPGRRNGLLHGPVLHRPLWYFSSAILVLLTAEENRRLLQNSEEEISLCEIW